MQKFGEQSTQFNSSREAMERALYHLHREPMVLVLDSGEAMLQAYGMDEESDASIFLSRLANPDQTLAKVLLLSQWIPPVLRKGVGIGIRVVKMPALSPQDTYFYFNYLGIRTTLAKVIELGERLRYHPLSLRLVAGVAIANNGLENIDLSYKGQPIIWQNVLAWAFQHISTTAQRLLFDLNSIPHSLTRQDINQTFATPSLDEDMEQLIQRGFVLPIDFRRQTYFILPRVVRRYLFDQPLPNIDPSTLSPLLKRLVQPSANTKSEKLTFPDADSAAEGFKQLVQIGKYNEAFGVFRRYLVRWHGKNGSTPHSQIELLRTLVPLQPGSVPLVGQPLDPAWLLSYLA
ncbi:MAG: hypothetical protein KAG66_23635, partial [Methylococcales bacterium]|nr:hypothetical protein [Methylococcales bacterium]